MAETPITLTDEASFLRGPGSLHQKIETARLELLDLSTRNRLIHTPRGGRAKTIEVVNELAASMYKTLVIDGKRFTFEAGREDPRGDPDEALAKALIDYSADDADGQLAAQPDEPAPTELDEHGRIATHWDDKLQTRLTSAGLQKRLSDLYLDARTLEEEQGVNSLYLAVGYLRWQAPERPKDDRFAPLVLIPVRLERNSAGERYRLEWSGTEIQANLSLQLHLEKLGLELPPIVDFEQLDIDAYLDSVEAMIAGTANWGVERNDAVLGLFSFAKFMMYRDLDPAQWTATGGLEARAALRGIVSDGFPGASLTDGDLPLDPIVPPVQMMHVVDCDSSQALVVHDVRQGTHVLVQGPPGTGKSQTIANIIAAAVADGKRVLFVAEKMAALEVVKRRLDQAGIGAACLELHSNKTNKRAFLTELSETWTLGAPRLSDEAALIEQLTQARDELNAHVERLHRRVDPAELTPYEVLGQLVRLRREGHTTRRIPLTAATSWTPHAFNTREAYLRDLIVRIDKMGLPATHPWGDVGVRGLSPNDRDRTLESVGRLDGALAAWRDGAEALFGQLDLPGPQRFADLAGAKERATRLVQAPAVGTDALVDTVWDTPGNVEGLLAALEQAQALRSEILTHVGSDALAEDWTATVAEFATLPASYGLAQEVRAIAQAGEDLGRIMADVLRLAQLLAEREPLTFDSALRLVAIGEHAASVPDIERQAIVAHIWDRGVDSLDETIESVERFQAAKMRAASAFRDSAWDQELEGARAILATLGGSWLRWLNGDWRRANRHVRGLLVNPKLPAGAVLETLDELLDGQTARRRVADRDAQAAEAFGRAWQRDRSNVEQLKGISSWMRSLRPLGDDARERLADVGDRRLAHELAVRVRSTLERVQTQLFPLSEAMVTERLAPWGDETVLRRVPLESVRSRIARWASALDQAAHLNDRDALTVECASVLISRVVDAQAALRDFEQRAAEGVHAFGPWWSGLASDAGSLRAATRWVRENDGLRVLASRTSNAEVLLQNAERIEAQYTPIADELSALFTTLEYSGQGAESVEDADLVELSARLDRWQQHPEGLPEWVSYQASAAQASSAGLDSFVQSLNDGSLPTSEAVGTFELAYYEALWALMTKAEPDLHSFDGQKQDQLVEVFARLDWDRMMLARSQVAKKHHAGLPTRAGAVGAVGELLGEMAKRQRQLPIRRIMEKCAPVVQAIKPVFMMSPLSIAQFLPPDALQFDLLVVDEASQVQPVDALGAIARAKQLVIVGDERQLPPTSFFAKATSGTGKDTDDDTTEAGDVESILGLCRARGLPERMLRWHYRSRHQSLIAISNREFYRNELFIVPSPYTQAANLGLRFTHLPNAVYDRGGARDNPEEAQVVAEAVIEHAKRTPELSLGVATFSTAQRRAIWDRIELLRRQYPETEAFFDAHPAEPFFVKSLENIQGDERDVIYISVGYGRDAHKNLTMNFGPLSNKGGERRLNVLISRAKSRCEVFSSITDDDIDSERAKGAGVLAFKLFLRYARTGQMDTGTADVERDNQVFVAEVARALKVRGYETKPNVGVAGLFVDLGVIHPDHPDRFVLGVECDGHWYRSAKSARDRERLRKSALQDKGWDIHRVWVTEWFQRPGAELNRLIVAIEKAATDLERMPTSAIRTQRAVPVEVEALDRGDVIEVGLAKATRAPWVEPYEQAQFLVPRQQQLHLVPANEMADIVQRIVDVEAPIHRDEIVNRVRDFWGLGRAGGRIQAAIDAGIALAIAQRRVVREHQQFLSVGGRVPRVRDRSDVGSLGLRRPEYLPPSEIDEAVRHVVRGSYGASQEEITQAVSRTLGFRATSGQLRSVLESRVGALLSDGGLRRDGERIVLEVAAG
jgi:very-short-patch-repair endonuclease